ncbi:unnamed protein product [Oppiella nova]|uniref:DnaJ homologue subfamily C member 28 conserved domain-containing protein n=1 Tax=Oppiella nova TaxID=334625 RepID=A0A7R9M9J5_9ACAR|nr:unnamed protein product [Oppiella nova]CAG2173033.1 unnamed protein product [Oppiella nova]
MYHKKTLLAHFVVNWWRRSGQTFRYNYNSKTSHSLVEIQPKELVKKLRNGYLESCRRTHPDLNDHQNDDTNGEEFGAIKSAYHLLKEYLRTKDNENKEYLKAVEEKEEEEEENKEKHRVAQHRQYLSMDGVGFGTPTERQKFFEKHRLMKATDRVNEFQMNKIKSDYDLSEKDLISIKSSKLQRDAKVRQGFERLVEDLIQESIARGEFDNLPGYGKPLKDRPEYPYLDTTTVKLNEILINNGFVPEWVLLEQLQSMEDISYLRQTLQVEKTSDEALKYFETQLDEAHGGAWSTKLDWFFHSVKHSSKT